NRCSTGDGNGPQRVVSASLRGEEDRAAIRTPGERKQVAVVERDALGSAPCHGGDIHIIDAAGEGADESDAPAVRRECRADVADDLFGGQSELVLAAVARADQDDAKRLALGRLIRRGEPVAVGRPVELPADHIDAGWEEVGNLAVNAATGRRDEYC